MADGSGFGGRVALCDDGAYRWTYDIKANGNDDLFRFMVGVCLAVCAPIALIMLVLIWQYGAAQALLSVGGFLALTVLLPMLIWKLLPMDPSFRMDETEIETWPKGRGQNIFDFRSVRRVEMRPDVDLIKLRFRLGALRVYAPREDYEMVREYILARVPREAEVLYS